MTLQIRSDWLQVDGAPARAEEAAEDRVTLGEIEIVAGDTLLTEAVDTNTTTLRRGANLSAYQLAEWLAWHWWRLRWETRRLPRPRRDFAKDRDDWNWGAAHRLADAGNGWLWPNIIFESDGTTMTLQSERSPETPAEPLRFLGSRSVVIPAETWEDGVDEFLKCVLDRLADEGLKQTALAAMWAELRQERDDPELAAYRRIEAHLGLDVDRADPQTVEGIYEAGSSLGHAAMMEVVADKPATVREIETGAGRAGVPSRTADRPSPIHNVGYGDGRRAPWRVGVNAARELRDRERLGDGPIADPRLADLCALPEIALRSKRSSLPMAFSLRRCEHTDSIVLRSRRSTGRRFEAARLLGDALLVHHDEPLRPATAALTYRQKMQRAFAAEFLCPIESLANSLEDLSDDAQQQAARHFKVSPWAVATQLVNNGFLSRQEIREPDLAP